MKKTLLLATLFYCVATSAQVTLVLQPNGQQGKDAQVNDLSSNLNVNFGSSPVFASYVWQNGSVYRNKALIQFDLTAIPANAVITSATLDLYADNPTTTFIGNPATPMNGSSNASYIRRITQPWQENTVTWANQPTVDNTNQVTLPNSSSTTQDYLGVDVTQLVNDLLTYGNNGFMIEPVSTIPSNSMVFRSSEYADSAYRPRLTIVYTYSNCLTLRPGSEDGKDSQVNNQGGNSSTNYGSSPVFASYIWSNGSTYVNKALVQFDLSTIPANATITSALLDLYADSPTTTFVGNPSTPMNGTNNASYISRITDAWAENTVTWNNQPAVSALHRVTLPTSTSSNQNYIGVDIAALVQDMVTLGNYGFMIEPVSASPNNSMVFRSSEYGDSTFRPQLTVCYEIGTALNNVASEFENAVVYPNPSLGSFTVKVGKHNQDMDVEVRSLVGQTLLKTKIVAQDEFVTINTNQLNLPAGVLLVSVYSSSGIKTFRVINKQ